MATRIRKAADNEPMFFSAYNYKMIGLAILLIVAGFSAMYFENEVNGFISLYISPIVVVIGYVLVIFAIIRHDRDDKTEYQKDNAQ